MSAIINHINPINWFNYKGENNNIELSPGTNVLVGTNNAGKTKLHNAFRYILSDTVILKVKEKDGQLYREINPNNPKYILEIFNNSAYSELKVNDIGEFGVEISFTKKGLKENNTYLIKKLIKVRKISDSQCELVEEKREVFNHMPHVDSLRRSTKNIEDVVNRLILPMYRRFFLIEGEQMGMMTPLQGDGLKKTIKNLTTINAIDGVVDKVDALQKKVVKDKRDYEDKREDLDDSIKELNNLISDKEDELDLLIESIGEYEEKLSKISSQIEDIEISVAQSQKNQLLLKELKKFQEQEDKIDQKIDLLERSFLDSLTDSSTFLLSKLFDENDIDQDLQELDKKFDEYSRERRIELEKNISTEDQDILSKLIATEPHPDILKDMLSDKLQKCYICKSSLEKENIDFLQNILIPHFEHSKRKEDDFELGRIISIKDSVKDILFESRFGYPKDELAIENFKEIRADYYEEKENISRDKRDFIAVHGDKDDLESSVDELMLKTFSDNNQTKGILIAKIESEKSNKGKLETVIENLKKKIPKNLKDEKSQIYEKLKQFIFDLDKFFETTKENIYRDFASSLQEKAFSRFKSLMRHNPTVKNHKLIVDVEKKELGYKTDYSFEIYLQDKFGKKLTQEGGASSTLEPLSVVFGLIDYSNRKQTYPFIADAPISRLTEDTKLSFFETIINDDILSQNIIICMDLWDNKKNNINQLAGSVLELLETKKDSSFLILSPKENNTGVEYKFLKNGK